MKKLLLILLIIGSALASNAQAEYYWQTPIDAESTQEYIQWKKKFRDSILKNKITNVTVYKKAYNKKGRLLRSVLQREEKYDSLGDLVLETLYDHKGRPTGSYNYTYNKDGLQTGFNRYNAKGQHIKGWKFTLNDKGLVTQRAFYWKKDMRLGWHETIDYNEKGKPVKTVHYDKKDKPYYAIENDYYENGSKKETRQYKKGKLKSVLKYDCQPTGTLANGRKADTTTYCTNSVYDVYGNKITTTEVMKQNGKVWRMVAKTNKSGYMLTRWGINPKGKEYYHEYWTYNDANKIATYAYVSARRPKYNYTNFFEYDENGRKTVIRRADGKGRTEYELYEVVR